MKSVSWVALLERHEICFMIYYQARENYLDDTVQCRLETMILIGENIHVVSNEIRRAIEKRDPEPIQRMARLQADFGASYLDLNLGPLTRNPVETTQWVVTTVQEAVDLPLSIDTPNPMAMEAGLEVCKKKPLINSVSGMNDSKNRMLPLAQKYHTDVVLLVMDNKGLPSDANDRASCMLEMIEYANNLGIPNENIWVDGILMPASVNQDQIIKYLEFIKMVPDLVPGIKTITGLSNISSCGTPKEARGILDRAFMTMVNRYGQSAVIANVLDAELIKLNKGELSRISELIYQVMDGEEISHDHLSQEEAAYKKTVDMLMGRKLYSHSWLAE